MNTAKGHQSASGPGCRLDGGYHRPVGVETDVGPLHHYQRRGGADNKNKKGSDVRGDLSLVADGFMCKRCDGTIQEDGLAGDQVVGGDI